MRKKIVAGNWKMNGSLDDAISLTSGIIELVENSEITADILILAPPYPFLDKVSELVKNSRKEIKVAAQNCSDKVSGAFTGEVSVTMLESVGAQYVILGHSERRNLFNETDERIAEKVRLVLSNGLRPIFCCGESLDERKSNNHFQVVSKQLDKGLFHLTSDEILKCIIAYEPVWAIGTGETASPAQAQEMHIYIRRLLKEKFDSNCAEKISILYGGSCNEKNAAELFSLPDVDGGLIGGASLKAESFTRIAQSFR